MRIRLSISLDRYRLPALVVQIGADCSEIYHRDAVTKNRQRPRNAATGTGHRVCATGRRHHHQRGHHRLERDREFDWPVNGLRRPSSVQQASRTATHTEPRWGPPISNLSCSSTSFVRVGEDALPQKKRASFIPVSYVADL